MTDASIRRAEETPEILWIAGEQGVALLDDQGEVRLDHVAMPGACQELPDSSVVARTERAPSDAGEHLSEPRLPRAPAPHLRNDRTARHERHPPELEYAQERANLPVALVDRHERTCVKYGLHLR